MKRLTSILLVLLLMLALAGCSQGGDEATLKFDQANTVEGMAQYEIANLYVSHDVVPPMAQNVYMHFQAPEGSNYLVLVADVQNLQQSQVLASDLMTVSLAMDGKRHVASCVVEEEGSTTLAYGNATQLESQQTARLYYLIQVPEDLDTSALELTVQCGEESLSGTTSVAAFAEKVPTITPGTPMTTEAGWTATVEEITFSQTLNPPTPTGLYNYYEAAEGNVYLIVKMTVENSSQQELSYNSIAGVTCTYEGTAYGSFCCFEEDQGTDLNAQTSQNTLPSGETGTLYYVAEIPEQAQEGPVAVSLYLAGSFYTYQMPAQETVEE
mgnify:CR=1 FL=1